MSEKSSSIADQILKKLQLHNRRALECISEAHKYDKSMGGHKVFAVELYRRAIKEMEDGIASDYFSGIGDIWGQTKLLHEEMKNKLSTIRDRLHFLEVQHDCINGNKSLNTESNRMKRPSECLLCSECSESFESQSKVQKVITTQRMVLSPLRKTLIEEIESVPSTSAAAAAAQAEVAIGSPTSPERLMNNSS